MRAVGGTGAELLNALQTKLPAPQSEAEVAPVDLPVETLMLVENA